MANRINDDLEGKRLNENYRVTKVLQWSEHSVICEAERLDTNCTVELAIIEPSTIRNSDQFTQLCKNGSKLKHPHLLPIMDLGETTDGEPFLSSEPRQTTLAELLKEKVNYDIPASAALITSIIDALIYLERLNQKPVLIEPFRIFLYANKHRSHSAPSRNRVAQQSSRRGEPLNYTAKLAAWNFNELVPEECIFPSIPSELERTKYAPPELLRKEKVDARAQIYSLACIFYELIAGKAPFESDELLELQSQILCGTAPRLHESRPDLYIDPAIEKLIFKALEKDPSRRYRSLLEFRTALQQATQKRAGKIHKAYSILCASLLLILIGWTTSASIEPIQGAIKQYIESRAPLPPDPFGELSGHEISPIPAGSSDSLFGSLPSIPTSATNLGEITHGMHLKHGNYYCNRISLSGKDRLTAEQGVDLWVKPEPLQQSAFTLSESASVAGDKNDSTFTIYYLSQNKITMSGQSKIDCQLYAPAATIEASGDAIISGEVTSNGQILRDNAHFTHVVDE